MTNDLATTERHAATKAYRDEQDRHEAASDARRIEIEGWMRLNGKRKADTFSPIGSFVVSK